MKIKDIEFLHRFLEVTDRNLREAKKTQDKISRLQKDLKQSRKSQESKRPDGFWVSEGDSAADIRWIKR